MTAIITTNFVQPTPANAATNIHRYLAASFETTPAETGMNHPTAQNLHQWCQSPETRQTVTAIATNHQEPHLAWSVLTCLATIPLSWEEQLKADLLRQCLASPSILIRDAGIGLSETWAEAFVLPIPGRPHRTRS